MSILPRIQKPAPSFQCEALMPNEQFQIINKKDFIGNYLILFFYPFDFTFVCPTEIILFNERYKEFESINTKILAISCDSKFAVSRLKNIYIKLFYYF